MKRPFLITLAALLLIGIAGVVWTVVHLPPVDMLWRYGFSYGPEPTGRTFTVADLEFVEIGAGCLLMGSDYLTGEGDTCRGTTRKTTASGSRSNRV